MHVTFKVDMREWNKTVRALSEITNQSLAKTMMQTGRALLEDCMMRTPPIPSGVFNAGLVAKRHQGEKAIASDIYKVFRRPKSLKIIKDRSKKNTLGASIRKYIDQGKIAAAQGLLAYIGFPTPKLIRVASPTLHENQRNQKTGRVIRKPPKTYLVTDWSTVKTYIKTVQKRVFKGMSGWNKAAEGLKARASAWPRQAKSFHEPGWFRKADQQSEKPFVEFGNLSPFMQHHDTDLKIIAKAMEFRLRQMQKDFEFKLNYDLKKAQNSPLPVTANNGGRAPSTDLSEDFAT